MSELPYGFVPIPIDTDGSPKSVSDTPVFHDGRKIFQNGKEITLLSGELRCTLTALTPLLAANDQYKAKDANGAHLKEIEEDEKDDPIVKVSLPEVWKITELVSPEKSVLEPLRCKDGRVLIPGTQLKGMLRQSLGALLAAPMERVAERSYSYRPNLEFPPENQKKLREPRAAIVKSWDEQNQTLRLMVLPFAALSELVFVCNAAAAKLPNKTPGGLQGKVQGVRRGGRRNQRLEANDFWSENLSNYRYYRYAGGGGSMAAGCWQRPLAKVARFILMCWFGIRTPAEVF